MSISGVVGKLIGCHPVSLTIRGNFLENKMEGLPGIYKREREQNVIAAAPDGVESNSKKISELEKRIMQLEKKIKQPRSNQ